MSFVVPNETSEADDTSEEEIEWIEGVVSFTERRSFWPILMSFNCLLTVF